MTTTQINQCPTCGKTAKNNGEPVTVSGWYGDVRYGWGKYAGVHACRATRYRCRDCDEEWPAEPDWDKQD